MTVWRWFNFQHATCNHCGSSDVKVKHEGRPSKHVLDTLGWIQYRRGAYVDAEKTLSRAADKAPNNATLRYHLGMTYYQLGRKEDAIASLKRSLQLDEKSTDAAEARRVLRELGAS